MLCFGGLDFKIHCYSLDFKDIETEAGPKSKIHYLFTLKGHENAITDIKFTGKLKNNSKKPEE